MKYDLKKPCANCPLLRSKKRVSLRAGRIREIHNHLVGPQGGSFPCHKTVKQEDRGDEDDDTSYTPTPNEQHCAGGLIYALAQDNPNQLTRVAMRLRLFDPDELLKQKKKVFGSLHEWLETAVDYDAYQAERDEVVTCSIVDDGCEAPAGYLSDGGVVEGDESAEFECYVCGEPVCGACSSIVKDRRTCNYCNEREQ